MTDAKQTEILCAKTGSIAKIISKIDYKCEICGLTVSGKGGITRHMASHTKPKKNTCSICNKYFSKACHRKVSALDVDLAESIVNIHT